MARLLKRAALVGAAVAAGYAVRRIARSQHPDQERTRRAWLPSGLPAAPVHIPSQVVPPGGPEASPMGATWVAPLHGVCPPSHPVKATLTSGLFHVPGDPSYDDAVPDRCYVAVEAAETDGLRQSRR